MFLEGSGGLRLGSRTPDLLVRLSWNWWHVEVEHMPFGLLSCAGLVGGRPLLGMLAGIFQLEHRDEAKQESGSLLSEALEKYRGAPAPGDPVGRAEVLGKSR